jgi:protein tyrosine phosphatase (PTP) superfamily phosphohydrolase (DUF442 family)
MRLDCRRRLAPVALLIPMLAAPSPADGPRPGEQDSLASAPIEAPEAVPGGEAMVRLFRCGPIFLAGQPDRAALGRFAEEGVTVVINLRPPQEMDALPFDEPEVVRSLGLDYVRIPIRSGEYAPRPEALDQLAEALRGHRGKALLHCSHGLRVTQIWAAYLVRDRGIPREEADAFARTITGAPARIDGYLGAEPPQAP